MYTFKHTIDRAMRVDPDGTAVVCGDDRLSYAQLFERITRLKSNFGRLGLEHGDRVAIVAANCHRLLELYLAVPMCGLVVVPLNARHTEAELEYALQDSGARLLFTDRSGVPAGAAEHVIRLDNEYEALLDDCEPNDQFPAVTPDDLAGLFYTGGTTGASKGVMLTHGNLIANAIHTLHITALEPGDSWLVMAPMFHAAGTMGVLASVWAGVAQVVTVFEPTMVLELVERESITVIVAVPTMIAALVDGLADASRDVSSVRRVIHGGAPIARDLVLRATTAFSSADFVEIYGSTELSPLAAALFHEERLVDADAFRACGQQIIGVDLRVFDDTGHECAEGSVGEIVVQGPNVMAGYWNKPEETEKALRSGWYWTGDLGYLDQNSRLYLVDRSKDMIISGGENVYSTEVEQALYAHPAVSEAAVFAVPDDRWGERVHAAVVVSDDTTSEELIGHCRRLIADYKVPQDVDLLSELPKSPAGKILKRSLREPYWAEKDTEIA